MSVQDTYTARIEKARAGMIAGSDFNTKTGICETVAGIGFGLAVSQGANSDQGVVLGGASKLLGVSVRDITLGAEIDAYPRYANVGYLSRGQIWVSPAVSVVPQDAVTYDSATGRFSNTGGVAVPGAKWLDTSDADGFARIELLATAVS